MEYTKTRHSFLKLLFSFFCHIIFFVKGQCCTSFKIDTIGGGNFYQGERLGVYGKVSQSQDGRNIYKQVNGDNYMYFLQTQRVITLKKNFFQ